MAHAFFLGIDARSGDTSGPHEVAYALIEKSAEGDDTEVSYRLNRIRHRTDVASAADLADHLQGLIAEQPYIGRTSLIVNRSSSVGEALVEALRDRGMDPVAAALTDGSGSAAGEPDEMSVSLGGGALVRMLADLHWNGQLSLEGHTSETASHLARDVQALAEHLDETDGAPEALGTSTAGPTFDPGALHMTSAALATWLGTERSFDPSQHLKGTPQTESPSPEGR